jgi:hypothetical protein
MASDGGPAEKGVTDGRQLEGVRVLVVEDDLDSCEMLCELLTMSGATYEIAPDVATAREKLSSDWVPDIVIVTTGLLGSHFRRHRRCPGTSLRMFRIVWFVAPINCPRRRVVPVSWYHPTSR